MVEAKEAPAGPPAVSALVSVGDELLLGKTVDTNSAWLGRRLAEVGIPVGAGFSVADSPEAIEAGLRGALEVADLVVLTGGLGPTRDDLTLDACAGFFQLPLREDPAVIEALQVRFRRRGYGELPRSNRSQALVPKGAVALPNPLGTAPGILLDRGDQGVVVLLPGVPEEMRGIFDVSVAPYLESRFPGRLAPVSLRTIHTTGIAESVLADKVEALVCGHTGPAVIAFLPDIAGVDIRLTSRGIPDADEARLALDELEKRIAPAVDPYRYEASTGDLAEALGTVLTARGMTLAVAESCTGGLIAKRITDCPGAARYFLGGVVAYSNGAKQGLVGVDPTLIESNGAVSAAVAEALSQGVRRSFGSDTGIGITGIAGPGGGTEEKPVGTVWFCASVGNEVRAVSDIFPGNRDMVRRRAAQAALNLLFRMLSDEPDPAPRSSSIS